MNAEEPASLTAEQQAVVRSILEGHRVLAKAGAGSGKTRTLVEAYALLAETASDGNPYERILAITFTNEAAYKLRRSVYRRTGGDIRALLSDSISTIHSFCLSVLSEHLVLAAINPTVEIADEYLTREEAYGVIDGLVYDEYESSERLRELITLYGYSGRGGLQETIYSLFISMRSQGVKGSEAERILKTGLEKLLARAGDRGKAALESISAVVTALIGLLTRFWERFEAWKKESGRLTFDDIVYYTYLLFRENEWLREHYRSRYSHVMVDEFQDTDRLQYEIINMISGPGNQAFVGDFKQSIYEWRNADPSIMRRVEAEIRGRGSGPVLEMRDNFRSTPELILFFNMFFGQLLGGTDAGYSPMRHANKSVTDVAEPAVRVMMPGGKKADERRKLEAELICSEIRRLLASACLVYDDVLSKLRPVRLSDIAILFRRRGPVKTYENVLRESGIPFIHVQSESFFEEDEVMDLLNYLRHIAYPADPYFTVASLRSPMFASSDATLLALARNSFDFGKTVGQLEGEERRKLELFMHMDDFASTGSGGSASRVLAEAVRRTSADLVYLSAPGGKQAYANVLKLLDMLERMERDEPVGLKDAVSRLDTMASEGSGESEYPLNDERSDAIRLMTVHASKGLEFPVVFVADSAGGKRNGGGGTFFDMDLGIIPGIPGGRGMRFRESFEEVHRSASENHLKSEVEENLRVLYVSLTRARQILYFSEFEGARDDGSWNSYFRRIIPVPPEKVEAVEIAGCTLQLVRPSASAVPEKAGVYVFSAPPPPAPALSGPVGIAASATAVADYMVCPYRSGGTEAEQQDGDDAAARGSTIHSLLEDYDYMRGRMPSNAPVIYTDAEEKLRTAEKFIQSAFGKEAAAAAEEGRLRREVPFSMKIGRHSVSGKIDMLIRPNDGGGSVVIDYKTGYPSRHRAEYRNQLMLYALALGRLTGESSFRLVVFALDRPDETVEYKAGEDELGRFENELRLALDDFEAGSREARPSAENCRHCHMTAKCPYSFDRTGVPPEDNTTTNMG